MKSKHKTINMCVYRQDFGVADYEYSLGYILNIIQGRPQPLTLTAKVSSKKDTFTQFEPEKIEAVADIVEDVEYDFGYLKDFVNFTILA